MESSPRGRVVTVGDSEDVIAKALRRREELVAELRRLDDFLELYAELSASSLDELLSTVQAHFASKAKLAVESVPSRRRAEAAEANDPSIGMPQREFTDLAKELLISAGRPLGSHQLLTRFQEAGRHVGGTEELRNLTTKLWRARPEIIKVPGAGYWPRDVACPAVRYVPPSAEPHLEHLRPTALQVMPERLSGTEHRASVTPRNGAPSWETSTGDDLDDEIPF